VLNHLDHRYASISATANVVNEQPREISEHFIFTGFLKARLEGQPLCFALAKAITVNAGSGRRKTIALKKLGISVQQP
jgi:hypothetical protein